MAEHKATPQIRFTGFSDDWEERELSDVADYRNGKAHEQSIDEKGEYIVVNSKFVSTDGEVKKYTNKLIEPLLLGEIAFVLSDVPNGKAIAKTFLVTENDKYSLNQRIACITPHDFTGSYFLNILMNRNKYFLSFDDGAKQTNLSISDVQDFIAFYPDSEEQQKIGAFFKDLDTLIDLHHRKYDKLIQLKKAMLEKMFPKNGSKAPEIRFAGFSDDWEECQLSEIVDVYDGTHQTPNYTDSGIMFLSVENVKTLTSQKFISKEDFQKEFKIFPQRGDVLMTRIGDIGTANIVDTDSPIAYYVTLALLKNKGLDSYFLKESIHSNSVKKELWHRTLHIAFPKKINKNEIEKVLIRYPVLKSEQERIGNYFRDLDTLIDLHQRKYDKLIQLKKAMLEKMFV